MSAVYQLRVWTRYLEPPERVWDHKTDPERLADEFQPWVGFRIDDAQRAIVGGLRQIPHEDLHGLFQSFPRNRLD